MRIHTDNPDAVRVAVRDAARRLPGVYPEMATYGSRKRGAAIELVVSADERPGRRRRNGGTYGASDEAAATWDEWGAILAAVFDADPDAVVPRVYDGRDGFHWSTDGRFADGPAARPHDTHRWEYVGSAGNATTGRTWSIHKCKGSKAYGSCDAVMRRNH